MQQIISPNMAKHHRMTGIHRNHHHANNNSNNKKSNDDSRLIGTLTTHICSSTRLEYLEFHDIYFRDLLLTSDSNKKSNNDNHLIGTVTTHICSHPGPRLSRPGERERNTVMAKIVEVNMLQFCSVSN